MRISDWSSDVCSSDLLGAGAVDHVRRDQGELGGIVGDQAVAAADQFQRQLALAGAGFAGDQHADREHFEEHAVKSEEHTSELQSLMRISYAVFCLKKKKKNRTTLHRIPLNTAS